MFSVAERATCFHHLFVLVGRQKMELGGFDEELGLGNLSIIWTMSQTLEFIAS